MLCFENQGIISEYDINLIDSEKAKHIVAQIQKLGKQEFFSDKRPSNYVEARGNLNRTIRKICTTEKGLKVVETHYIENPKVYADAIINTANYEYLAPYTLALAAQSLTFGPFDYSEQLKKFNDCKNLSRVIGNDNLNHIRELLLTFNTIDQKMAFLEENYQDIFYLNKYLNCITLYKVNEYPNNDNNDAKIAVLNSEVVRKLELKFKGL